MATILMPRRFDGDALVIASHNRGKVQEIADLLAPFARSFAAAADHGVSEPEETGTSFTANAELKARHTAEATGLPALADDSGLVVPGLGGEPGVHTALWAQTPNGARDFAMAMRRLNDAMEARGVTDRKAYFVCALALAWPDGHAETVEGEAHGVLVWPPRGDRGFGFDPMFVPEGSTRTYAEIEPAEKHRTSHRAAAFRQLVTRCFTA